MSAEPASDVTQHFFFILIFFFHACNSCTFIVRTQTPTFGRLQQQTHHLLNTADTLCIISAVLGTSEIPVT